LFYICNTATWFYYIMIDRFESIWLQKYSNTNGNLQIPAIFWNRNPGTKIVAALGFLYFHFMNFLNKIWSQFGFVPSFFLLFYSCSTTPTQYALIKYVMTIAHIYFIPSIFFGKKVRMKLIAKLIGHVVVYMKVGKYGKIGNQNFPLILLSRYTFKQLDFKSHYHNNNVSSQFD
jgi:hypothetical protein